MTNEELLAEIARLEKCLHERSAHPDYEYTDSITGRKQADYRGIDLEDDGWELNAALFNNGFFRDDYNDTQYWRRKLPVT